MRGSFGELDRILRGEATRPSALRRGSIELPAGRLAGLIVVLGFVYGACMGTYAVFKGGGPSLFQLVASTVKVPLLFLLTVVVTFPSLYVFNALVGSRLNLESLLRLLVAVLAVMLAVLASFGPIVAFFSVSTTSYPFMLLLNVVVFTVAGLLGLKFLLLTLHRLTVVQADGFLLPSSTSGAATAEITPSPAVASSEALPPLASPVTAPAPLDPRVPPLPGEPAGALDRLEGHVLGENVKTVFRIWIVLFGLVGAQMGWVLRPFIGSPDTPFAWFRARESNFFESVFRTLGGFFS